MYPYPAKFVYGFTRRRQREILELRRRIEDETPLTIEDSRRLRAELRQADQKHRDELDQLAQELARAREQLEKTQPQPPSVSPQTQPRPEIRPRITPSQRELLLRLERAGGKATHSTLVTKGGQAKVQAEFDLGEMERLKLLKKDYDQGEHDYTYEFTHEGRRFVLEDRKSETDIRAREES